MGTVYVGAQGRYAERAGFSSALDPFADLILHLEFLTAIDSAAEFLRAADPSETEIPDRATAVSRHAKTARAFLEQAREGPETVAFVSAYYGALNLSKIIILFSPLYSELAANRYHGVTYNPTTSPKSLADDEVRLKQGGALPLLYRVLTGELITAPIQIQMRDVYALIVDVSAEWSLATGGVSWIAGLEFRSVSVGKEERLQIDTRSDLADALKLEQLPALLKVEPDPGKPGRFRSVNIRPGTEIDALFEEVLDRRLLYYPQGAPARTAIGNLAGLGVIEELPLLLAFYHLASVARYNPEFLDILRSSRYWPVAAALVSHGLYKFLLLFWCHLRRRHVFVSRV